LKRSEMAGLQVRRLIHVTEQATGQPVNNSAISGNVYVRCPLPVNKAKG